MTCDGRIGGSFNNFLNPITSGTTKKAGNVGETNNVNNPVQITGTNTTTRADLDNLSPYAALGVDIFYIVEFTKELAKLPPDTFLTRYVAGLQAKEISCGFDYTYGSKASGNVETLAVYAATHQIGLTVVDEFKWQEEKISSTRIRECLRAGKLYDIFQLLGTYHTTKYCQHNGVLPYYSLPRTGRYRVFISTADGLIPCMATVLCQKRVQFHHDGKALPRMMTIQWVSEYESAKAYRSYA